MKEIIPKSCPICNTPTNYIYRIEDLDKKETVWYRCPNGVIFQSELPEYVREDKRLPLPPEYNETADDMVTGLNLKQIHEARTYINLVEETTYGRKFLNVGFTKEPFLLRYMKDRGWLVWGIDNTEFDAGGNLYKGDFLLYDFEINEKKKEEIKKEFGDLELLDRTFDLIWMSEYLAYSFNPRGVIEKAYDLLSDTGILYLSVPDIEFIHKRGIGSFPHWDRNKYVLWSKRAITRELERQGFEIIACKRNISTRYRSWDNDQILAQKRYY